MCELTGGFTKPACASNGGVKSVVVMNTENIDSLVVDPSNSVTTFSLDVTKSAYRITPDMASIVVTETATRSRENNSLFYASTCAITLKDDSTDTRNLVDLISKGFITVIEERENGNNYVYGAINGMTVETGAFASGQNYEDMSGVIINLVGKEISIAPSILTANFPTPIA